MPVKTFGFLAFHPPRSPAKPHPWNSPTIRVLSSVRCRRNGSGTGTTAGSWGLLSAAHSAKPSKSGAARHPQSAAFPFLAVAVTNIHWAVVFLTMMPMALLGGEIKARAPSAFPSPQMPTLLTASSAVAA